MELEKLINYIRNKYKSFNLSFYHLGDLVDRGPDSGRAIDIVRQNFDGGVLGNHEQTMLRSWTKHISYGYMPQNPMKAKTISQLNQVRVDYLRKLPLIHVFDNPKIVLVHGGLYPKIPFYMQSDITNVCRLQMLKESDVNEVLYSGRSFKNMPLGNRWWGPDARQQPKIEKTEEESMGEGYRRWYEVYDHDYDVFFGHSVLGVEGQIFETAGPARAISLDTGASFGGMLTAVIYPDMDFIQVETKEYAQGKNVKKMMEDLHGHDSRINKRRRKGDF